MKSLRLVLAVLAIQLTAGCASLDSSPQSTATASDDQYANITELATHAPTSSGGQYYNSTSAADTEGGGGDKFSVAGR